MKYSELQKKTDAELKKQLVEKQNALRVFYFENTGSHTRNVKEGHHLKKDIARIQTAINEERADRHSDDVVVT